MLMVIFSFHLRTDQLTSSCQELRQIKVAIVAFMYIKYESKQVLPDVIYQRRKARCSLFFILTQNRGPTVNYQTSEAQVNAQLSHGSRHSRGYSDATSYGGHSDPDLPFSPTQDTGSISGLSKTATVSPHEGASGKPCVKDIKLIAAVIQ